MDISEARWNALYRLGSICVILAAFVMIAEIFLTLLPDGARVPLGAEEYFQMFSRNAFMAMRHLGLVNIVSSTLLLPVALAIYAVHRKRNATFAGLALMLQSISYAIFMSDNSAFAMLELSSKYLSIEPSSQIQLVSAADALLAKGSSHTPGTFPGFFLGILASVLLSGVMLREGIFSRATALVGLVGFSLLFLFESFASFIPSLYYFSMVFALPGGILAIAWYFLIGIELNKMGRRPEKCV